MHTALATMFSTVASAGSASTVMQSYVTPVVRTLSVLASVVSVFFLVNGAYHYLTSSGRPEALEHAKRVIRNALIGLVIVLSATVLTAILSHAYVSSGAPSHAQLPALNAIQPEHVSNGLVDILIKAITGLLNNIIQSVASPFLKALAFFTTSTPLMADNSSVFNLWLAIVGMTDALFVLVVALLGFHVMSATSFGFDEIEFKHLLPRLAAIFLLLNTSIFVIDGIIELSNAMIHALSAGISSGSVWEVLTSVVKKSGGQGVAALLIMIAFVVLAFILLVYYVGRLVTLYIGAMLSPIVLLLWLIPGFRDFSETAIKTYLTTIFVLFVHVVILGLAASLFTGMSAIGSAESDILMSLVVGLATVFALLKTQGVMLQFSYVSMGARSARKLSGQFMNGLSAFSTARGVAATGGQKVSTMDKKYIGGSGSSSAGLPIMQASRRQNDSVVSMNKGADITSKPVRAKTGNTTVAPSTSKISTLKYKEKS